MKIPKVFMKTGLVLSFAAALAGCGQSIGPNAKTPELRGETSITQVFNGGPQQNLTRIQGTALQEKQSYNASGELVINGSVPANTSISVDDGKLVVNGNVGDNVSIHVSQPVKTHNENYADFCYGYNFMSGKFDYSYKFSGCDHTVVDGLRYNDPAPAVEITGTVGQHVSIDTRGRIVIGGQQVANRNQLAPAAPRAGS